MERVGCPDLVYRRMRIGQKRKEYIKNKTARNTERTFAGMKVTYDRNVPIILPRTLGDSIGVLNAFRSCLLNMSDKRVKLTSPGFVFLSVRFRANHQTFMHHCHLERVLSLLVICDFFVLHLPR